MKLDIEKAIKYPLEDQNWLRKVGIYAGFIIITAVLTSVLNTISKFTGFLSEIPVFSEYGQLGVILVQLAPSISQMFISMLVFPVSIYFSGYLTETTKNVMNGKEEPLPEHTDLGYKFKLWLGTAITGLVPGIIQVVLIGIFAGPLVLATIYVTTQDAGGIIVAILVLAWIVAMFICVAILIAINLLIVPAMQYLYLKNEDFSEIVNIQKIKEVIRNSWKEFLLLFGVMYVLNIIGGILSFVLCFIGFIVKPLVTIAVSLSKAHLTGQIYKGLKPNEVVAASSEKKGVEISEDPVVAN